MKSFKEALKEFQEDKDFINIGPVYHCSRPDSSQLNGKCGGVTEIDEEKCEDCGKPVQESDRIIVDWDDLLTLWPEEKIEEENRISEENQRKRERLQKEEERRIEEIRKEKVIPPYKTEPNRLWGKRCPKCDIFIDLENENCTDCGLQLNEYDIVEYKQRKKDINIFFKILIALAPFIVFSGVEFSPSVITLLSPFIGAWGIVMFIWIFFPDIKI